MNCPECGTELHKISVIGIDDSWRCADCGGVRVAGWVINRMAEGGELKIVPTGKTGGSGGSGKSLACPEDGNFMVLGSGGELPPDVPAWSCSRCKWWWIPGDHLFVLKHAFDVRNEYHRQWKRGGPISSFALPVVLTMVLTVGLGVAVMAVRDRAAVRTQAVSNILETQVMYHDGRAEVSFTSRDEVGAVAYKRETDEEWILTGVAKRGDWQVAVIEGVKPGEKVQMMFGLEIKQISIGEEM